MNNQIELLRIKEVLKRVPLSKALIYKLISLNQFPAPKKLSERTSCWHAEEINNWLRSRGIEI